MSPLHRLDYIQTDSEARKFYHRAKEDIVLCMELLWSSISSELTELWTTHGFLIDRSDSKLFL